MVRILAALVLLTAAGLKCVQLSTEPVIGHSILDSRWLLMATVEFELFFGFWLLANILPKLTWGAAVGCFGAFTCVSLYKALAGYDTCGCWGAVKVNPWYTSASDLAFVVSLLIWRPRRLPSPFGRGAGGEGNEGYPSPFGRGTEGEGGRGLSQFSSDENGTVPFGATLHTFSPRAALVVLLAWLSVGLPAAYAMGSYSETTLSDAGTIVGDGTIVLLEPEKWIGKRFPLCNFIDIGDEVKEGTWLVMLYHYDCPRCRAAIRDLSKITHELGVQRVALVSVPPYGDNDGASASAPTCIAGHLSATHDWFAETPVMAVLHNATVVAVRGEE